jgi:hypothetical protein
MNKKNTIENLYKKSATESSPKDLDNLILAQAKANCNKKFNKSRIVNRTWLYGLSTAAVFVMGMTMIINLQSVNDQAMLPIELENSINQSNPQKSITIKKAVTKNSNETQQMPDDSKVSDTKPILESPMPQAVSLSTKPIQLRALKEETIQETDDNVISDSANFIQPVTEKLKKSSVARNISSAPKKESANNMGAYIPKQDSITSDKQESIEQPKITVYDRSKVIVRNEDEFTPTQKKIVKATELRDHLINFKSHVEKKEKQQAKELLERITKEFPGYDFTVYYETLQNLK